MSFENFTPNAAKVLFVLGWILAILTFLTTVGGAIFFGRVETIVASIVPGLVAGANMLVIPWIAAAILWRIDQYLETRR